MDTVDCRVFRDQLDAADRGDLTDEGRALLQAHAAACTSCASLLRLRDGLPGPSLEELEAAVPEAWVTEMAPAVRRALAMEPEEASPALLGGRVDPSAAGRRPGVPWVPLLAAAVLALLLSTGLALRALADARAREAVLAGQLLDQQRRLAGLVSPSPVPTRGARLPGRDGWLRALEARETLTVADLRSLLDDLPAGTPLLGPGRARELARSRLVPSPWREAFRALPVDGGVTAAALRDALDRVGLPEDAAVPTHRLLDLFS